MSELVWREKINDTRTALAGLVNSIDSNSQSFLVDSSLSSLPLSSSSWRKATASKKNDWNTATYSRESQGKMSLPFLAGLDHVRGHKLASDESNPYADSTNTKL